MTSSKHPLAAKTDWKQLLQDFLASCPKKPLIVVLGPTASGKTDFSITLAKTVGNAEIVNADSRQMYRGLDIGTAKITTEEMRGVPHHLLSVLDPKEELTIAWYQREATRVIEDIQKRGAVPMLVGGSMLYLSSIIDGLTPIASDPVLRKKLSDVYDSDGGKTLMKRLQELDPESADNIPQENKIYLVRALEIIEATGKPKSSQNSTSPNGSRRSACVYDLLIFGISIDPEILKNRINQRTEKMLASGWIEEVRALLAQGYTKNDPGMMSHGYREIMEYPPVGEESQLKKLSETISANVRKYAKRQRTWWRNDPRIQWITVF